jgi:hypothetical protein
VVSAANRIGDGHAAVVAVEYLPRFRRTALDDADADVGVFNTSEGLPLALLLACPLGLKSSVTVCSASKKLSQAASAGAMTRS